MDKLLVSFSGGRTSAFMAHELKCNYSEQYEMVFVFANTGEEWESTLEFVDRCDKEWGLGVVWVEAVPHEEGIGTTHRIVDFESASRRGEPFEAVIKKFGIPNKTFPHCTRELKFRPITSYARSIGWSEYKSAIGMRADEPRRITGNPEKIVYPLAHWFPTDKPTINDWWGKQPFNLGLMEHQGNCKWCWKKSLKKHIIIAKESPEAFQFPAKMENIYPTVGAWKEGMPVNRTFFREYRSTRDIFALSRLLKPPSRMESPDEDSGCSESCEPFQEEIAWPT